MDDKSIEKSNLIVGAVVTLIFIAIMLLLGGLADKQGTPSTPGTDCTYADGSGC